MPNRPPQHPRNRQITIRTQKNEGIARSGELFGAAAFVLVIYALLHAVAGLVAHAFPRPAKLARTRAMENGTIARTRSYHS